MAWKIPRRWTQAVKARSPAKKVRMENVTAIMYPAVYGEKGWKRQLEEKLNTYYVYSVVCNKYYGDLFTFNIISAMSNNIINIPLI